MHDSQVKTDMAENKSEVMTEIIGYFRNARTGNKNDRLAILIYIGKPT